MSIDLDRDIIINGHEFKAGKDVDTIAYDVNDKGKQVKTDYAESIQEQLDNSEGSAEYANTHHGAVPVSDDPNAVTAGTPTRPLGAAQLRADETTDTGINQDNITEVTDPPSGHGANEPQKNKRKK